MLEYNSSKINYIGFSYCNILWEKKGKLGKLIGGNYKCGKWNMFCKLFVEICVLC